MAQRPALLLRKSWQAKICESMHISSSVFSVGHFDPLILLRVKSSAGWRHLIFSQPWSATGGIRLSSWQPDFQRSWGITGRIKGVILTTWFLRSGSDVLQVKPKLSEWKLRQLRYWENQVPKMGTWFGRSCKSSYGKRNLISDNRPNSHFEDLGVSN